VWLNADDGDAWDAAGGPPEAEMDDPLDRPESDR